MKFDHVAVPSNDIARSVEWYTARFGAKVKSFNTEGAAGVAGVRYVIQVPSGVAVVAATFWAAKTGRDALKFDICLRPIKLVRHVDHVFCG